MVSIWHDKWLPKPTTFQVASPQNTLSEDVTVNTLIDVETGEWKAELIRRVFLQDDADTILSVPLSKH